MKQVNTYGLKMTGLEDVAQMTGEHNLGRYYFDAHIQVFYDKETDETWGVFQPNGNTFTRYHDSSVVSIGCLFKTTSMQDIADKINSVLNEEY